MAAMVAVNSESPEILRLLDISSVFTTASCNGTSLSGISIPSWRSQPCHHDLMILYPVRATSFWLPDAESLMNRLKETGVWLFPRT